MKPSENPGKTFTPDFSKIVLPQPWPLTEQHHSRIAHNLPKWGKVFSCCVVRILAAYDTGPQPPKKKDVAALALQASEAVDAFTKAMEAISREEYPNASWLRGYETPNDENTTKAAPESNDRTGGQGSDYLQKNVLETLKSSPYWTEKTRITEKTIQGLTCPTCHYPNAWAHPEQPIAIQCIRSQCKQKTKTIELVPELSPENKKELGEFKNE